MAETCLKVIIASTLLLCGVQDILKKKVYLWLLALSGLITMIFIPFCSDITLFSRLGGLAVGVCVILLSFITGGKIGIGDGILLCITGMGLGFWANMELFGLALTLAAVLSIVLLVLRKADRKMSIPFIPFMFTGYMIILAAGLR